MCALALLTLICAAAHGLTAPTDVRAYDVPNDDAGKGLDIEWAYEAPTGETSPTGFHILRASVDEGQFVVITAEPLDADVTAYRDAMAAPMQRQGTALREEATTYLYRVRAVYDEAGDATADSAQSNAATARGNLYHTRKTWMLLWIVAFAAVIVHLTRRARAGHVPKIRRIAGLEAVDEAIGRATEMGRPILYVAGIGEVSQVATIASINIYSHVARRSGDYGTRLTTPCHDPIMMQIMRSVSEQAYLDIGRPDAYNADDVFFVTQSQFAFAAAVDGIMVREKPAAIFLQGVFYAESLILAETGNSVGAIQIAGTDKDAQLPFFIAACDYTLIGEELFAASAYLSGEGHLLSTIRAQDIAKATLMACLVVGAILQMAGIDLIARFFEVAL
ncbi:hypothetical protein CMK11_01080 [Candidatus Poribacteria bacterium]|nr:hypothetical protein [Candidatus Poribacteria bacterium]